MNAPVHLHAPRSVVPAWSLLAGAAFAASLSTVPPGLALVLASFGRSAPDLRALLTELPVAVISGVFGAVHVRAQLLGRGRWVAGLVMAANLALVAVLGVGFDISLSSGSVDSGPAFIIGLFVVAGVLFANGLLAGASWWLLAALAKKIASDSSGGGGIAGARVRAATWVLAAAIAHVAIKGVSGGPVAIGVLASVVAGILLLGLRGPSRPPALVAASIVVTVLGLGATASFRVRDMKRESIAKLAQCTESSNPSSSHGEARPHDALARAARQVPDVVDAASDVNALPNGRFEVSLYVLPTSGGPLAPALQASVERAIAGVKCTEGEDGSRPAIAVKSPSYVPIVVRAHVMLRPGSDESVARANLEKAVRESFEVRADRPVIASRERAGRYTPPPAEGSIFRLELHVGQLWLEDYVRQLPAGSVVRVERVETEVVLQRPPTGDE